MAITETCTYDESPPRRPALADLQTGLKLDDAEYPPDDTEMPTAGEANQQAAQLAAIAKVMPVSIFHVRFTAGVADIPSQSSVQLVEPAFTVVENAAGDTSITWPANTFPSSLVPATAALVENVDATISCAPITNGVRVRTRVATVLTDAGFVVTVY